MARFWYAYIGFGNPYVASSYSFAETTPGCINGSTVCAINVESFGTPTPTAPLSRNIKDYISAGLATGIHNPRLYFHLISLNNLFI
jgi:hypothetical protein